MPVKRNKPVFITGQQLGLLGGPLYTIYKIVGAIHYAQKENGKAVFWMEGNDADFNEINHFFFHQESTNFLKKYRWNIPTQGLSVGKIKVDAELCKVINNFLSDLPPSAYKQQIKEILLTAYRPGITLADAMSRLISYLFKDVQLEIFDATNMEFIRFIQPILLREAELTPDNVQADFFISKNGKRQAVFRSNGFFVTRTGEKIQIEKEVLLPNVKTRSICQDAYFAPKAYVAGPGEVAYLSTLSEKYKQHDIKQSGIIPRMSATILTNREINLMKELQLKPEEMLQFPDPEAIIQHVVEKFADFNWLSSKRKIDALTGEYIESLKKIGFFSKNLSYKIRNEVKLEFGQKRQKAKEKIKLQLNQANWLQNRFFPLGKKQERVLNLFQFVIDIGLEEFIKFVLEEYGADKQILELKHD